MSKVDVILETPQQLWEAYEKPNRNAVYYLGTHLPEEIGVINMRTDWKPAINPPSETPVRDRPEPCPVDSRNRPVFERELINIVRTEPRPKKTPRIDFTLNSHQGEV